MVWSSSLGPTVLAMFPSIDVIESYVESVEDLVYNSWAAAAPDLPDIRDTFNRLWDDVSRFGPVLSDIHVPSLGDFQVPPPPPPPPPPKSFFEQSADWCSSNPWKVAGISTGAVGAVLLMGYASQKRRGVSHKKAKSTSASSERRQVVVVLGGNRPLALPLILDLEKKGYIVLASVSTSEAVDELEQKTHGYVRALVLDPTDPATIPLFLRSLASTMSRRFPINTGGDPHASPSMQPYIHSIISLLTLSSATVPPPTPLEHLSLDETYLPYLQSTHIAPLQVIQALLPMLRTSPARAKDALANNKGKHTIVVCLPAIDTRVGLPFASAQAMSAAATLQGIQILRREIKISAMSAAGSDSMKNLRVVTIDVGSVEHSSYEHGSSTDAVADIGKAMESWTPSEKAAYGPSVLSLAQHDGPSRRPTNDSVFVDTIVRVVGGTSTVRGGSMLVLGVESFRQFCTWIRGDRIVVGAGAGTYSLASNLPSFILDALLNLPHFLISVRNALVPMAPSAPVPPTRLPSTVSTVATRPRPLSQNLTQRPVPVQPEPLVVPKSQPEPEAAAYEDTGSEGDVESNSGDTSGVESSWVSLNEGSGTESPVHV